MASANSERSKANLRPWQPGHSGNPSGRPKGIASKARELIGDDPTKLLGIFLEIAEDDAAKPADRVAAVREYLDRAYGKSATFAPIDGEDPLDLTELAQIRSVVDELANRRAPRPNPEAPRAAPASDHPPASLDPHRPPRAAAA